jgi:hypothetical protein
MTTRRKPSVQSTEEQELDCLVDKEETDLDEEVKEVEEEHIAPSADSMQKEASYTPTGKIFVGEEDKRLIKKYNQQIIKRLGLSGNRSIKL